jgi:hypothetical protein
MKSAVTEMLESKKFLAVLLVAILAFAGPKAGLSPEAQQTTIYALIAYIVGQGIADAGQKKQVTP